MKKPSFLRLAVSFLFLGFFLSSLFSDLSTSSTTSLFQFQLSDDGIRQLEAVTDVKESSSLFYRHWEDVEMVQASPDSKVFNISIIVEVTGEFGNHLNHIAHGRMIQTLLWKDHKIASHLILRRNSNDKKYRSTYRQLVQCMPSIRSLKMHGPGSDFNFLSSQKSLNRLQGNLIGIGRAESLSISRGSGFGTTQHAIQVLVDILSNTTLDLHYNASKAQGVSIPFIYTDAMINREIIDRFYDDFRGYFYFDKDACCDGNALPSPDVPVFHFRNFLGELKNGKAMGMEELSPKKVANDIFEDRGHERRQKIAIATRFPGKKSALAYADALRENGLDHLWLSENMDESDVFKSVMQDFCAMISTKELVGMVRSTFVVWAALLGRSDGSARLYSVESASTRKKSIDKGRPIFRTYNWTHSELKKRIKFELYRAEDIGNTLAI